MIRTLILACVLFLMAAGLAAFAKAPVGITLDPEISSWFRSLENPVIGMSCCDVADGRVLRDDEWRATDRGYEAKIAGAWVAVPPEAVLQRVDNPTGGAVLFVWQGHILCFVRPVES